MLLGKCAILRIEMADYWIKLYLLVWLLAVVVDVGEAEQSQSKDVSRVFQVVGEMWDETLMKSVGSSSLATEKDASVVEPASDAS